jgi:hypothetical protein
MGLHGGGEKFERKKLEGRRGRQGDSTGKQEGDEGHEGGGRRGNHGIMKFFFRIMNLETLHRALIDPFQLSIDSGIRD